MPLVKQAIVIGASEGSERFARLDLFSPENGYFSVLRRKSQKRSGQSHADLFQTIELTYDQKKEDEPAFLKETTITVQRQGIGKSYTAFDCASRFCRIIYLNAKHMAHPEEIYQLIEQSLDAWNSKPKPSTTYFKALFRLASEDGFPVKELWLSRMKKSDFSRTKEILVQPLTSELDSEEASKELAENLTHWLTHQQEFLF